MKTYKIYHGEKAVGVAKMTAEGLYRKISCQCTLPQNAIHRIYVQTDGKKIPLGVCVPKGEFFFLERKVASKHFGQGEPAFIVGERPQQQARAVPIKEDEPFAQMENLHNARFEYRDGEGYAVFPQEPLEEEK